MDFQQAFFDELEKIAKVSNIMRALSDPITKARYLRHMAITNPESAAYVMKRHIGQATKAGVTPPKLETLPHQVLGKYIREAKHTRPMPPVTLEERLAKGISRKQVGAPQAIGPSIAHKFRTVFAGV